MSSPAISDGLDFDRDVPTSAEDVRRLREIRSSRSGDFVTELQALAEASRSLRPTPRTSTSANWMPFEL